MNYTAKLNEQPKISIGMPVYNGEKFIRKSIDSALAQTFIDFELIISDNGSTDSTSTICTEYAKKDKRIRYVRQQNNMGAYWNFDFTLKEAKYDYFVWLAVDDFWHPDFLKKNLDILVSRNNVVCSISKVEPYELPPENLQSEQIDTVRYPSFIKKYVKKRRWAMISVTFPVSGSYEKKIRSFLKNTGSNSRFYGLYRTKQLQQCFISKPFIAVENAIFLNLLKIGDLYELDKVLMYRYDEGWSTNGIINMARRIHSSLLGILSPFYPFTNWCAKNIGIKNFMRNLDIFFQLNIGAAFFLIIDLLFLIKNKYMK